jgi:hypothetical protein
MQTADSRQQTADSRRDETKSGTERLQENECMEMHDVQETRSGSIVHEQRGYHHVHPLPRRVVNRIYRVSHGVLHG